MGRELGYVNLSMEHVLRRCLVMQWLAAPHILQQILSTKELMLRAASLNYASAHSEYIVKLEGALFPWRLICIAANLHHWNVLKHVNSFCISIAQHFNFFVLTYISLQVEKLGTKRKCQSHLRIILQIFNLLKVDLWPRYLMQFKEVWVHRL